MKCLLLIIGWWLGWVAKISYFNPAASTQTLPRYGGVPRTPWTRGRFCPVALWENVVVLQVYVNNGSILSTLRLSRGACCLLDFPWKAQEHTTVWTGMEDIDGDGGQVLPERNAIITLTWVQEVLKGLTKTPVYYLLFIICITYLFEGNVVPSNSWHRWDDLQHQLGSMCHQVSAKVYLSA